MKNMLRWTPERYAEHMAQRVARAQAECDRILGVDRSDPAPASDPRDHRWTDDELAAMQAQNAPPLQFNRIAAAAGAAPKKAPKYRNQKVEVDGIVHDSGKEARRWAELCDMAFRDEITCLLRQVPFELAPAVHLTGEKRKKPALRYVADFTYRRDGVLVVEDAKSRPTRKLPAYRIKKHLMKTVLNLDITEV